MEKNYRQIEDLSEETKYPQNPSPNTFFADAQKGYPTRPQAQAKPEAYPLGYVEDFDKPRTTLGTFFSIRLKKKVALGHGKHRHRVACQDLPVGLHDIGFRIHFNLRQRIVQLHIALADAAAFLHRHHAFLQPE